MSQEHLAGLFRHCRVCGSPFTNKKGPSGRRYVCSDRHGDLLEVFGIDVKNDLEEEIHPQSYCHPCNNIIYHTHKTASDGKLYNPKKVIATWSDHTEHDCPVCTSVRTHSLGGWPKKQFKSGRPARGSFQLAIQHIKLIAPSTFCKQEAVIPPSQGCFDCTCPICLQIIDKPIELTTCKRLVCADCLCQWLQLSQTTSCPCCYTAHLNDLDTIHSPSEITLTALGSIEVTCCVCRKHGYLKHHKAHLDSMCVCQNFKPAAISPSDLSNRPEELPLLAIDQRRLDTRHS